MCEARRIWNGTIDLRPLAIDLEWADRFLAATLPFSTGEVYVNSLDEGESHRIRGRMA
jgi:hypothetical protein